MRNIIHTTCNILNDTLIDRKDNIEITVSTKYPLNLSETEKQDIIQYPSVLCGKLREIQRYLSTKKYKEDEKESEVISLILHNLPLFIAFLHLDPVFTSYYLLLIVFGYKE